MATRIKFKQAGKWIKENPAIALSGTGVAISATNLAVNSRRRKESKEYQDKQLEAMGKLTNSINGLDDKLVDKTGTRTIFKLKR